MGISFLAERIRELMKEKGLTYEDLARRAGIAERTLELALKDPVNMSLEFLMKIAWGLGVSIVHLFQPVTGVEIERDKKVGKRKRLTLRIEEVVVDALREKTEELGISRNRLIEEILRQVVQMEQVRCPECDRAFWVKSDWEMCPYCGVRRDDKGLMADFIIA